MTARDRIALIVVLAVVLLAGFWYGVLGPKRKEASTLRDQLTQATQRLDTARRAATTAGAARARYDNDYTTVARLGKAVPSTDDVPSLMYQLHTAASRSHVDFRSIKLNISSTSPAPAPPPTQAAAAASAANGTTSTTPGATTPPAGAPATPAAAAPTQTAAAGLPPGSTVGTAGFPTMPFDFVFDGGFFQMEHFFGALRQFTGVHGSQIVVRGRLLTVDGFSLSASRRGFPAVKAQVTATAYLLPQDEGTTASGAATAAAGAPGATPAAPALVGGPR